MTRSTRRTLIVSLAGLATSGLFAAHATEVQRDGSNATGIIDLIVDEVSYCVEFKFDSALVVYGPPPSNSIFLPRTGR